MSRSALKSCVCAHSSVGARCAYFSRGRGLVERSYVAIVTWPDPSNDEVLHFERYGVVDTGNVATHPFTSNHTRNILVIDESIKKCTELLLNGERLSQQKETGIGTFKRLTGTDRLQLYTRNR